MGIQPIDLQTMYSQLSNISQNVSVQQNAASMTKAVSQEVQKNQTLENSQKVSNAASAKSSEENSNSTTINADGHNSNGGQFMQDKNQKKRAALYNPESIQPDNRITADDSSPIGRIVDISR